MNVTGTLIHRLLNNFIDKKNNRCIVYFFVRFFLFSSFVFLF